MHVAVLGGGACGMAAALELVRRGAKATVLEREPRVGGLCGTHEKDGFRFDFGGHRFITADPEIDGLVLDLVGGDLLERRRSSVVLNGGKRFRYPLELDDVLRQYGLVRGFRALASYLLSGGREDHFAGWVTRRFGTDLYGTFFGPYTEKLWGISPETISADWAAERISVPNLWDVCLRLLHVPRPFARTYARGYRYPRLGIGQIFERCAERVTERGGSVLIGAEVFGLDARAGAVRYRHRGREQELSCDGIISTLSLPALARMTGPLPPAVERSAGRLRFRAIRLMNILLEGPPVSPHTWMYVSEPRYLMARIQEPIHRSPQMAPAGATSLMLEIPCTAGDATWSANDAAIYERCVDDLGALGFKDIRSRTRAAFSTFVHEGYPIYHLGYREDRRAVLGHVASFERLVTCGRQGAFRYVFMDTAMQMGISAARSLLAGRPDPGISELAGRAETRAVTA